MGWVFAALIVVVIAIAFIAGTGRLGQMAPQIDDRPVPAVPTDRALTAADLGQIKFAVVARGYSMEQVDAVLDRLAAQLGLAPAQPAAAAPTDGEALGPVPIGWPGAM